MLNFRARKSLSQMDFKEARRTGNYQLVAHVPSPTKALLPSGRVQQKNQEGQLTIKDESLTQLLLQDAAQLCSARQGNVRFVVNGDQDVRIASLRIFNTIMLRSWRRRRQEVRTLNEQVEDFKRNVSGGAQFLLLLLNFSSSLFSVRQESQSAARVQHTLCCGEASQ